MNSNKEIPKLKMREEILALSIALFAQSGYDGVSMRDVASGIGVTPAALYYHFPDKEQLYLNAVTHAFKNVTATLNSSIEGVKEPWPRLESVIAACVTMFSETPHLRRLMQWVLLDGNEQHLRKLVNTVFEELFLIVHALVRDLDQHYDAHLLTVSVIGLVVFHFETAVARPLLPGYSAKNEVPAKIARHVIGLLRNGLSGNAPLPAMT